MLEEACTARKRWGGGRGIFYFFFGVRSRIFSFPCPWGWGSSCCIQPSSSCCESRSELPKRLEMRRAGYVCRRFGITLGRFCVPDGEASCPSEMTGIPLKHWRRPNVDSQQACNAAERTDLHFLPRLKRAKPKKGIGDCHFRKK